MNLNELRELGHVDVFDNIDDLFERLSEITFPFDTSTREATVLHCDCDIRLVEKVESKLEPLLGAQGIDGNRWFHEMDYYGDGVRLIEAEWSTLSIRLVENLQDLLCGEHDKFCVLWKVYEDYHADQKGNKGALAIFKNRLLVSSSVITVAQLNA